jgi:hypothetical protein
MTARRFAVLLTLMFLIPVHPYLHGGSRRRAVAVSPPSSELSLTFVDVPNGTLDAGSIAARLVTRRTFGIRIGRPSREAQGSATLRAFLETADPRCIVRIDGVVLGTQPRLIQRHAPIGVVTAHRLEIEAPPTAAEGPVVTTIGWEVTTE